MEADSTGIVGTGATHARLSTSGSIRLYLPYDNINELPYESVSYSGTSIWEDTTLEDLGLSTGSYEIRWDSGNQGINMTVVPEPSVAALLGVSAIALFTRRRRK